MSKKSIRIISTLLTVAIVIMLLPSVVFADQKPSNFVKDDKDVTALGGDTISLAGKQIIKTIRTIGMIVAIVILMVLGIRYMMGSAEEKASYKKTMMPYIVGAILIFGASAVADVVYDFAVGLGNSTTTTTPTAK